MYPLLRVQVSLADAPGDAEREAGCVSRGWEREPADTDTGEMGQELQERVPESAPQGLMRLGAEPWCPGPVPTSAEREETSRRGVQAMVLTASWSPQWAGLPQASCSPPASIRGGTAMQIGVLSGPTLPLLEPWWWSSGQGSD